MSKKDEQKWEPTLLYPSFLEAVARVRQYGIKKYGKSEDWRTTESIRHFDAALRHIYAFMRGEEIDESSGLSHLAHAAANLMFEIERRKDKALDEGCSPVEITCPRCKYRDEYPSMGAWPCTSGCGYFVEAEINLQDVQLYYRLYFG